METDTLIRELSGQGRPVTPIDRPSVGFLRWAALAIPSVAVGVGIFGARPDWDSAVRSPTFLALSTVMLALGACSALSAFALSVPDRARRWPVVVPAALLALWLAVLAPALVVSAGTAHAGHGLGCVAKILAGTLFPGALLYARLRRRAPLNVGGVGILAALGAVALGALGAQFICHNDDPLHSLLWHYVPAVTLAVVGIFAGRRLFTWDTTPRRR